MKGGHNKKHRRLRGVGRLFCLNDFGKVESSDQIADVTKVVFPKTLIQEGKLVTAHIATNLE